MKLRNLNGLVRNAADKITVTWTAPDGRIVSFKMPRSLVVAGFKEAYEGEPVTYETGLTVNTDGLLMLDPDAPDMSQSALYQSRPGATYAPRSKVADEEDLLEMAEIEQEEIDLLSDDTDAGALHTATPVSVAADDDIEDLLA